MEGLLNKKKWSANLSSFTHLNKVSHPEEKGQADYPPAEQKFPVPHATYIQYGKYMLKVDLCALSLSRSP